MSKIRVWKLGSLEHRIVPSDKAMQKLADMLVQWDGKSDMDIIWDEAIDVQALELKPDDLHLVIPADMEVVREDNVLKLRRREDTAPREEPYHLELVKITDAKGKVTYQAADEKTVDNILNTSSDYTHLSSPDIQFEADFLGDVEIYPPEWMKKSIAEDQAEKES